MRDGAFLARPLTPELWADFERLMGPRGGAEGCWCMLWRQSAADDRANRGGANRALMRARVEAGPPPGLLAYLDGAPVGWISLAPRAEFPRMAASRILAPAGEAPEDWVVTCFFIPSRYRRRGLAVRMLEAAAQHAREQGAAALTGYPIDPGEGRYGASFAWTGFRSAFAAAGFREVDRRSEKRPVMVLDLAETRQPRASTAAPGRAGGGRRRRS